MGWVVTILKGSVGACTLVPLACCIGVGRVSHGSGWTQGSHASSTTFGHLMICIGRPDTFSKNDSLMRNLLQKLRYILVSYVSYI